MSQSELFHLHRPLLYLCVCARAMYCNGGQNANNYDFQFIHKCPVRIEAGTPRILTEAPKNISRKLHANFGIILEETDTPIF